MRTCARIVVAFAVAVSAVSCSKDSPSPTTPSGPTLWNLTGIVKRTETGTLVVGATVDILDGPNAGRSTLTNSSGVYAFTQLQESGFTVRVRHAEYVEMAQGVSLTADRALDFALTRILRADLVREGVLTHYPQPPNFTTWDFRGHGVNRGDGCAASITGTLRLLTALGAEVPGSVRTFPLPAGLLVRPTERFDYAGCCFTTSELDLTTSHQATFTWTTVACP